MGLTGQMPDDSRCGPSPRRRGSGNWLTHILMAVTRAPIGNSSSVKGGIAVVAFNGPGPGHHHRHGGPGHRPEARHHREQRGRLHRLRNAGRNDSGKRRRRVWRLRRPASGDEHVLGLHAAPTGTLAGSEQLGPGPSGKAFHVDGLPDPRQAAPSCRCPLPPQHQHPAQLVTGRRQHALQRERSRTGWPAYGVHVNSAVSFSVLPTIAHVSVRVAPAAPELRLPASRNSANQPGRHALSARAGAAFETLQPTRRATQSFHRPTPLLRPGFASARPPGTRLSYQWQGGSTPVVSSGHWPGWSDGGRCRATGSPTRLLARPQAPGIPGARLEPWPARPP